MSEPLHIRDAAYELLLAASRRLASETGKCWCATCGRDMRASRLEKSLDCKNCEAWWLENLPKAHANSA